MPAAPVTDINKVVGDIDKLSCTKHVECYGKANTVIERYRSYAPEFSKETEKQLVRKIDRRLLPLVVIIYLFNYLDRNSITQARLYGLQEDTHVTGALYQTAISTFSAGYIAMQLPATILMTKLRPSLYLVRSRFLTQTRSLSSWQLQLILC